MAQVCIERPMFRLDCEPWIPVLYEDGLSGEVSLRSLLIEAHRIYDIVPDMPQQKLPLLRLALAVLYRLYDFGGMSEADMLAYWGEMWDRGYFDAEDINAYFDEFSASFDLFDSERPFYQVPGLTYMDSAGRFYDSISEIIADCPKPKKFLMSLRAKNTLGDISFAEAARWLVFMQSYDPAGIKTPVNGNGNVLKGKVYPPKDSVGTGWMGAVGGVFLRGKTLFETLMLNWVMYDVERASGQSYFDGDANLAAWERPLRPRPFDSWDAHASGVRPGPAALYTWQSRRVRLVPNEAGTAVMGIVSCYGDVLHSMDLQASEPMTSWRLSQEQQKKSGCTHVPWLPVRHASGKSLWRGFSSLLALSPDGVDLRPGVVRWLNEVENRARFQRPLAMLSICAQGLTYGTQNSVIEDTIDDSFDVGRALHDTASGAVHETVEVIAATEEGVRALVYFAWQLDEISGSKHGDGSSRVDEQAYAELDEIFRIRIAGFSGEQNAREYANEWRRQTHRKLLELADEHAAYTGVAKFNSHAFDQKGGRRVMFGEALQRYRKRLDGLFGPILPPVCAQDSAGTLSNKERG